MTRLRPIGTMTVIALLLLLSGAIRIGTQAGAAFASAGDAVSALPEDGCADAPEALLRALQQRETAAAQMEDDLAARAAALDAAEAAVRAKLDELASAEASLNGTMAQASVAASGDVSRLVALYQAMRPQDAAAVITQMPPSFAAGFVAEMQPEAGAAILAKLDPQIAFAISAEIAGRNARAPTE